jgi:hypothetical protein
MAQTQVGNGDYICFVGLPKSTSLPAVLKGYLDHMTDQETLYDRKSRQVWLPEEPPKTRAYVRLEDHFGEDKELDQVTREWASTNEKPNPWVCRAKIRNNKTFTEQELPRLKAKFGKDFTIREYAIVDLH